MSMQQENRFQSIIAHAKEYGFVFPSSEIYDGLSQCMITALTAVSLKKTSAITGGRA